MISTKFGEEDGGWNTNDIRGGYGTGLWKTSEENGSPFIKTLLLP